jgi:hypothetical protein
MGIEEIEKQIISAGVVNEYEELRIERKEGSRRRKYTSAEIAKYCDAAVESSPRCWRRKYTSAEIAKYCDAAVKTTTIYHYNGNIMVNATQMAGWFGKIPDNFLVLVSTKKLIKDTAEKLGIDKNQLIIVFAGNIGTWMNNLISIRFAQWLSEDFYLKIKDILAAGVSTIGPDDRRVPHIIRELQKRENQVSSDETEDRRVAQERYINRILESAPFFTTAQIASEFGVSVETLNERLHTLQAQCDQSGYTETRTIGADVETVWTVKGRMFLHLMLGSLKTN